MQTAKTFQLEKKFQGVSLIIAPILFAASTFFWTNGEYSVLSATLIIFSMFFWIPALTGLFALLKNKMPYYSVWVCGLHCTVAFQAVALHSLVISPVFSTYRISNIYKSFPIIL